MQRINVTINAVEDAIEVNLAPTLRKDNASVDEDSSVVINVLANDVDPDGDVLTITAVSGLDNGSAVINGDNTITFTPDANYFGAESFLYYVSDGNGGTGVMAIAFGLFCNNF